MLHRKWMMRSISLMLCSLMAVPTVAAEAVVSTLGPNNRQVLDLRLRENGSILGKLVDRQGNAMSDVDVQILAKRGPATSVKTNQEGVFTAQGLATGELAVRVGGQTQAVRVWDAKLAPPSASPAAMFVVGDAVRGQCCPQQCAPACGDCGSCDQCCTSGGGCGLFGGGGYGGFGGGGGGLANGLLARPWLLGAGVAAAVAIPLALDDDDDAS